MANLLHHRSPQRVARLLLLTLGVVGLFGCESSGGGAASDTGATVDTPADTQAAVLLTPTLIDTVQVVPSDTLPTEAATQEANNNLDVTWHGGSVYLAFRTAPWHFASDATRLHVVRADDGVTFEHFEVTFHRETDLREPRFLSFGGELFLFFAVLGTSPFDFEPQGAMVTRRLGPGEWTEPEWFLEPGFIPWRAKVIDGAPHLIAYGGGENVYDNDGQGVEVQWLTSDDGFEWRATVPDSPTVLVGGVSETDLVALDDGTIIAVGRNELGDDLGFGSKICRAEADAPGDWSCVADPRKYDSPLLFRHGGGIWLVARRNVTDTGHYDLDLDIPDEDKWFEYQTTYWNEPKRCAVWRVDPEALQVHHVLDLPSRGDTCFPGVVTAPGEADVFHLYDYSSPLDGPDLPWVEGQQGPTLIHRHTLVFAAPSG